MKTATIKFQAGSYVSKRDFIRDFRDLIMTSTGNHFSRADVIQKNEEVCNDEVPVVTLYSNNGFIVKIKGLHTGDHKGEYIVDLLKYCGFMMEDATIYNILNQTQINITLWNKTYMN